MSTTSSTGFFPVYNPSNVYLNDEARNKIMRGVDTVADAVKITLGAAGANAVLESELMPGHIITNDGVSIATRIVLDDPIENMGANLVKEIASRSDKESGDGTTTSTVLLQAILHAGMEVNANPMDIKRSLDECLPLVLDAIDAQKRDITPDQVGQVATVSAENEMLGSMLQEIYQEIGKDGIVELDTSNLPETFYEITEGVRLRNAGWLGAYSSTEPGKAIYKKPKILISKQKIATTDDLEPILAYLAKNGTRELVLFVDDIDMAVASRMAATHLQGGFKTLVIKAPTLWKDWLFEDFARITGATVIDPAAGTSLKEFKSEWLGTCDKIITTKDETRVIGIQDISEYVAELKKGSDEDKLRASWLQTKVATLKLGANSESELSYLHLKAEDARNAAYLALQDGIVPGGGVALINASTSLPQETIGGKILREALRAPIQQIAINAAKNPADIIGSIWVPFNTRGLDAKTGNIVDMWEAGIVDPAIVTKNSIKNAISIAGTILTTKIAVVIPKEQKNETLSKMPGM